MKPDLTTLYSELGLKPDCSLAEFQLACRRRISELHPRRPGAGVSSESTAALRDLIGLYTTATRFHRRYGRLPGAAPHRPFGGISFRGGAHHARVEHGLDSTPERSSPPRVAVVMAVALLVLLFALLALVSGEWFR